MYKEIGAFKIVYVADDENMKGLANRNENRNDRVVNFQSVNDVSKNEHKK